LEGAPRVALLGLGPWGRVLARTLRELGALRCAIDPDPRALREAAGGLEGVELSSEPSRAHERDVDAVVVATPIATHAPLTLAALDAGKDVLCEKPLALSLEDALAIRARARAKRRFVMVGHVLEYAPVIELLRAQVTASAIGPVRAIHAERLQAARAAREPEPLWELAVHDVGTLLRTVRNAVLGVSARRRAGRVELRLDLEAGVRATLIADAAAPSRVRRTLVQGERGALALDELAGEVVTRGTSTAGSLRAASTPPLSLECAAFLRAVRLGRPGPIDVDLGVAVVRVLHAAQTSIERHGARVPVDRAALADAVGERVA
jgi:predicted dehydrogenase